MVGRLWRKIGMMWMIRGERWCFFVGIVVDDAVVVETGG